MIRYYLNLTWFWKDQVFSLFSAFASGHVLGRRWRAGSGVEPVRAGPILFSCSGPRPGPLNLQTMGRHPVRSVKVLDDSPRTVQITIFPARPGPVHHMLKFFGPG